MRFISWKLEPATDPLVSCMLCDEDRCDWFVSFYECDRAVRSLADLSVRQAPDDTSSPPQRHELVSWRNGRRVLARCPRRLHTLAEGAAHP
jgi:hypothetical protein